MYTNVSVSTINTDWLDLILLEWDLILSNKLIHTYLENGSSFINASLRKKKMQQHLVVSEAYYEKCTLVTNKRAAYKEIFLLV